MKPQPQHLVSCGSGLWMNIINSSQQPLRESFSDPHMKRLTTLICYWTFLFQKIRTLSLNSTSATPNSLIRPLNCSSVLPLLQSEDLNFLKISISLPVRPRTQHNQNFISQPVHRNDVCEKWVHVIPQRGNLVLRDLEVLISLSFCSRKSAGNHDSRVIFDGNY